MEKLAELEHEQWMEWSKAVAAEVSDERRKRWKKYWVPYSELSEKVKEQDRVWARKVIKAMFEAIEENFSSRPLKTGKDLWDTIEQAARLENGVGEEYALRMAYCGFGIPGIAKYRLTSNDGHSIEGIVMFDPYKDEE